MEKLNWETVAYVKNNGEVPVDEFLNSLTPKQEAKVLRSIELLEEFGLGLGGPHIAYLEDGIYELRTILSTNIFRTTLFHWDGTQIVLLRGFQKKKRRKHRLWKSNGLKSTEMIF